MSMSIQYSMQYVINHSTYTQNWTRIPQTMIFWKEFHFPKPSLVPMFTRTSRVYILGCPQKILKNSQEHPSSAMAEGVSSTNHMA